MAAQLKKDIEEIDHNLSELLSLELLAKRQHVKTLLSKESKRLTQEKSELLAKRKELVASESLAIASNDSSSPSVATNESSARSESALGSVVVTNYMWDQTDDFVKIYIEIDKNYSLDSTQIVMNFPNRRSFCIVFGKYKFSVSRLFAEIDTEKCHHKRTKSATKLIIYLKKSSPKQWSDLTEKANKFKEALEEKDEEMSGDPSAGLMRLMKQMYNEGDDDMKRTIAKSWYESRNKNSDIDMKPENLDI